MVFSKKADKVKGKYDFRPKKEVKRGDLRLKLCWSGVYSEAIRDCRNEKPAIMITGKITNERKKIMLRFSVKPSLRINTLKWSLFTIGFFVGSKSGKLVCFQNLSFVLGVS